jgi:hypothetical protein
MIRCAGTLVEDNINAALDSLVKCIKTGSRNGFRFFLVEILCRVLSS